MDAAAEAPLTAEAVSALVSNHRNFLAFLQKRVGDRTLAEDILQEAFVRGLDKVGTLREDESATAWFYRVPRNSVIDHHRRRTSADRKLESFAAELERHVHKGHTRGTEGNGPNDGSTRTVPEIQADRRVPFSPQRSAPRPIRTRSWNTVLEPGETATSIGFCANRNFPSSALPFVIDASGTF
jgi:RNA polymerase sigma factor (sigma-70 family)